MSQRCQPEKCRPFCGGCDGNVIEALPLGCTVLESQTMRMTWTRFVPPLTSYFSELAKDRGVGGGIWAADEIKMGEPVSEASSLEDSLTPNGKLA